MRSLETLIQKFWDQTITKEELCELRDLIDAQNQLLKEELGNNFFNVMTGDRETLNPVNAGAILQALHLKIAADKESDAVVKKMVPLRRWWAVAASFIIITGSFWITNRINTTDNEVAVVKVKQNLQGRKV